LLSAFLIKHELLPNVPFTSHLTELLKRYDTFDLQETRVAFDYYDRLLSLGRSLQLFVIENKLGNPEAPLSFERILDICPPKNRKPFAAGVVGLFSELVPIDSEVGKEVGEHKLQFDTAATALFFRIQGDPESEKLCREVGWMDFGSRVLYEYATIEDVSRSSQDRPTLKAAVDASFVPLANDREFNSFRGDLKRGELHLKVSYLLSHQVQAVTDTLEKLERKGFEAENFSKSLKESVHDVLGKDVDSETTSVFLVSQVLSAYIVTVSGGGPGISLIKDGYLKNAAKEISSDSERPIEKRKPFENLIIIDSGSGSYTRVGVVPFGMTFEAFSSYFEEAFTKATKTYREQNPEADQITYYLTRIFPTPDGLKSFPKIQIGQAHL